MIHEIYNVFSFCVQVWALTYLIPPFIKSFSTRRQIEFLKSKITDKEIKDILDSLELVIEFRLFKPSPAAVCSFEKERFTILWINSYWFNLLNSRRKLAALYHEALHVKLRHDKICSTMLVNRACDLVINQLLVKQYGFEKKDIKNFATIRNSFSFRMRKNVLEDQTVDYYIVKLMEDRWF